MCRLEDTEIFAVRIRVRIRAYVNVALTTFT